MAWGAVEDKGRVGRELSFEDGGGVEANEGGKRKRERKGLRKETQGEIYWAGAFGTYF